MTQRLPMFIATIAFLAGCAGGIPPPESCDSELLPNCKRSGDLLFGGQPTPEQLEALAIAGYKTIVTTRGEGEIDWDEKEVVESHGMTFVSIPMAKPLTEISDEMVADFDGVMESGDRPMLLHCGSGNRVSGLWATWLIEHKGVGPIEALDLAAGSGMSGARPLVEKRIEAVLSK